MDRINATHNAVARDRVLRERWAFLRPWLALGVGLRIQHEPLLRVPSRRFSGFQVASYGEPTPSRMRRIREALVLLAVLARVDRSAYKHVLFEHLGLWYGMTEDVELTEQDAFYRPRFVLAVDEPTDESRDYFPHWDPASVPAFFAGLDASPLGEFTAAVRRVVGYGARSLPPLMQIDVSVVLQIGSGWAKMQRVLESLGFTIHGSRFPMCAVNYNGEVAVNCAFVVAPLEVSLGRDELTLSTAELIDEVVESGNGLHGAKLALVPDLVGDDFPRDASRDAQVLGNTTRRLLCGGSSTDDNFNTLDAVRFNCSVARPDRIERLCTAIAETRTTEAIALSFEEQSGSGRLSTRMWEQVAFALFSKHARAHSSITSVTLSDVFLTLRDVEAIAKVVDAVDPADLLFGQQPYEVENNAVADAWTSAVAGHELPVRATLNRGTVVKLVPMHPEVDISEESASWTLKSDVSGVTVLSSRSSESEGPSVRVLVPGYGVCTVARDQLVQVTQAEPREKQPSGSLTSFQVSFLASSEAAAGYKRLLELVGSSLTRLQLQLVLNEGLDTTHVMRCCPQLKTLIVHGPNVSSDALTQAYRDNEAMIEEIECNFDSLQRIVEELASRESPVAQRVRALSLPSPRYRTDWTNDLRFGFTSMLAMLSVNHTLEYYRMWGHHWAFRNNDAIRRHYDEPLAVTSKPFRLECRLAFLSIFRDRREEDSSDLGPRRVAPPIDRDAVLTIFAFAADCARRRLYFDPQLDVFEWHTL